MIGDAMKQRMARKFFESQGRPLLAVIAHRERRLCEKVRRLEEEHGLAVTDDLPDVEERVDQMQGFALAALDDETHEWYLREMAGLENVETAVEHAGKDADAWEETMAGWASVYRENGKEGTDRELADLHTRARHDVGLETFERLIVEWDDERERQLVEEVLAGGLLRAEQGVERATDAAAKLGEG